MVFTVSIYTAQMNCKERRQRDKGEHNKTLCKTQAVQAGLDGALVNYKQNKTK